MILHVWSTTPVSSSDLSVACPYKCVQEVPSRHLPLKPYHFGSVLTPLLANNQSIHDTQISFQMDFFNILYGFPAIPFPLALIARYRSSVPWNNLTFMERHTHDHPGDYVPLVNNHTSLGLLTPLQPPPNDPSEGSRLRHVYYDSYDTATDVSDADAPLSHHSHNHYQGYLEGLGQAHIPSQCRQPVDSGDPLPTEGSSTNTPDLQPFLPVLQPDNVYGPYFPQTPPIPSPEINAVTSTPVELTTYDYPLVPARDNSCVMYPNGSGDLSASAGSTRNIHTETTSLGMGSIYSTASSQATVNTHSFIQPPHGPSNRSSSIEPFSSYGAQTAHPTHQLTSKGQQHAVALSPIASSQVPAPRRTPKKYWCKKPGCRAGFTQERGLTRHRKFVHGPRLLCPHCRDFKWSPARKYALRDHYKEEHPGVALPESL
ncbi:hypothetical protein EI94DRAFT_1337073 [Lactarius quietus]|nr:hypothetical protein EI94DRAFT_1337073 [Lactarius quietus]